jgi:hypothetical protein
MSLTDETSHGPRPFPVNKLASLNIEAIDSTLRGCHTDKSTELSELALSNIEFMYRTLDTFQELKPIPVKAAAS